MPSFEVSSADISRVSRLFKSYPHIAEPIVQRAINASAAEVQKNATRETVPWRTGNLVQSFGNGVILGRMIATVKPTASYAVYVHEGTSRIKKPNKFMPRILNASMGKINDYFRQAGEKIAEALAKK